MTLLEVVIVVVILGIVIPIVIKIWPLRFIVVNPTGLTLTLNPPTPLTFTATLMAKGWGFGAPAAIAGTFTGKRGQGVVRAATCRRSCDDLSQRGCRPTMQSKTDKNITKSFNPSQTR